MKPRTSDAMRAVALALCVRWDFQRRPRPQRHHRNIPSNESSRRRSSSFRPDRCTGGSRISPRWRRRKAAIGRGPWNKDTVSYDETPALAAEIAGKVWLFTLGPKGGATPGGSKVAEIGPVPPITAHEYLLRVNHGYGPPRIQNADA